MRNAYLRVFFYLLYCRYMNQSLSHNSDDAFAVFFENKEQEEKVETREMPEEWDSLDQEGKLAVDIIEAKHHILVISAMAGAEAEHIEVYVHDDVLTVRGRRSSPVEEKNGLQYVHKENYWGKFSRTVVLPVHVKGELAAAEYKNGILTVKIPKGEKERKIPIRVVEE